MRDLLGLISAILKNLELRLTLPEKVLNEVHQLLSEYMQAECPEDYSQAAELEAAVVMSAIENKAAGPVLRLVREAFAETWLLNRDLLEVDGCVVACHMPWWNKILTDVQARIAYNTGSDRLANEQLEKHWQNVNQRCRSLWPDSAARLLGTAYMRSLFGFSPRQIENCEATLTPRQIGSIRFSFHLCCMNNQTMRRIQLPAMNTNWYQELSKQTKRRAK